MSLFLLYFPISGRSSICLSASVSIGIRLTICSLSVTTNSKTKTPRCPVLPLTTPVFGSGVPGIVAYFSGMVVHSQKASRPCKSVECLGAQTADAAVLSYCVKRPSAALSKSERLLECMSLSGGAVAMLYESGNNIGMKRNHLHHVYNIDCVVLSTVGARDIATRISVIAHITLHHIAHVLHFIFSVRFNLVLFL